LLQLVLLKKLAQNQNKMALTKQQRLLNLEKARKKWKEMNHSQRVRKKPVTRKLYKNAFHLPVETAVYVPSTTKGNKKVSKTILNKRVRNVRIYLSDKYGGYTSSKGVGGYVMKDGRLVKEGVVRVSSFATEKDFKKNVPVVRQKLKTWGKKWKQEAVGYEHEGDMYYIKSKKDK